jgi:predicted porin
MRNTAFSPNARHALLAALSSVGLLSAHPAFAETEIEQLRRELSEQRQIIERLLKEQESQTKINARVDAQAASVQDSISSMRRIAIPGSSVTPSGDTVIPGVTFYGTADVSVARTDTGFGKKTTVGTGGLSASRLGVRGERDVGNGLKAIGEVEVAVDYGTGVVSNGPAGTVGLNRTGESSGGLLGTGSQIFSRQAYVGLAHNSFGALTLGRQYAGSYIAAALGGAMGTGLYGNPATFLPWIGGLPTRTNNSLVYTTPNLGGLNGRLNYTVGSQNNIRVPTPVTPGATTLTTDQANRGWDLALFYTAGPFSAGSTAWKLNAATYVPGETGLATKKGYLEFISYDFRFVKLYAMYIGGTIKGGNYENVTKTLSKASGASVSATIPFGKHKIAVRYSKLDDKSLQDRDGALIGAAYTYDLYKNTLLYVSWGRQINNKNALWGLSDGGDLVGNVTTPGFSPSGVMMGVNISF